MNAKKRPGCVIMETVPTGLVISTVRAMLATQDLCATQKLTSARARRVKTLECVLTMWAATHVIVLARVSVYKFFSLILSAFLFSFSQHCPFIC